MTMRRFFYDPVQEGQEVTEGAQALLSEEESRHLAKVLRLQTGDEVELLDGCGALYRGEVLGLGRYVAVRRGELLQRETPTSTLRLGQAVLKGEKMDSLIRQCAELGVSRFSPVESSRCQGRLNRQQAAKKLDRWQRISLEACKQCRRLLPMSVDPVVDYQEFLDELVSSHAAMSENHASRRLMFWEEEHVQGDQGLGTIDWSAADQANSETVLLLGPEGGFSEDDVIAARQAGFQTVSLGRRILRAETATITGVSLVQYLAGNM